MSIIINQTPVLRGDISAGKVTPAIDTKITRTDGGDPNTDFPGTVWIKTSEYTVVSGETTYYFVDCVRIA
jgi:hypothetical protein